MKKKTKHLEPKVRFERLVGEYMALSLIAPSEQNWDMAAMTLHAALEPMAIPFNREELDMKRRQLLEMSAEEVSTNPLKLKLIRWFLNAQLLSLDGKIDFGKRR